MKSYQRSESYVWQPMGVRRRQRELCRCARPPYLDVNDFQWPGDHLQLQGGAWCCPFTLQNQSLSFLSTAASLKSCVPVVHHAVAWLPASVCKTAPVPTAISRLKRLLLPSLCCNSTHARSCARAVLLAAGSTTVGGCGGPAIRQAVSCS